MLTGTVVTENPAVNSTRRGVGPNKEATAREHDTREVKDPPARKARLRPPATNTGILSRGRTGKSAPRRDKAGTGKRTPPPGQDTAKAKDPNRLTKSGREPLPARTPALEKGSSRSQHDPDENNDVSRNQPGGRGATQVGRLILPASQVKQGPGSGLGQQY